MSDTEYGEPIEAEVVSVEECSAEEAGKTPEKEPAAEIPAEQPNKRKKVNALAIVAICLHWFPIAGLIISIIAAADAKQSKYVKDLRALAIVALALSITDTVLLIAAFLLAVFFIFAVGIPTLIKIAALILAILVALGVSVGGIPEISIGIDRF